MVAGVNGAGKPTSMANSPSTWPMVGQRAAGRADPSGRSASSWRVGRPQHRGNRELVEGGDPAAVSFDAATAGSARGKDVVLVDTAGRLPTQLHLMEELEKIRRGGDHADATAPHEVLLVIDGNTRLERAGAGALV